MTGGGEDVLRTRFLGFTNFFGSLFLFYDTIIMTFYVKGMKLLGFGGY